MKAFRPWFTVLPVSALVLASCEEKAKPAAPAAPGEVATAPAAKPEAPVETPAAPAVKALTPGERAAMLGIVGHLAKDTEAVLAVYDGKDIVSRMKSLKSWGFINELAKEDGTDLEAEMTDGATEAGKFLGQEVFFASGKGTGPQVENLTKLGQRSNYYQMRVLAQAFAAGAKEGDFSGMDSASEGAMMEMAKEIGKEMALVEAAVMPPLLVGIKAQDKESLDMAQEQIVSGLENLPSMLGEGAAPLEFTKGGATFKGYKLAGSFLAEQMEQNRADMEETLEPADVDRLLATLKTKNLAIAQAALGDYLMIFVGDNEELCPLADKVEDSLAANDSISFVDGYQGKKLAGFLYGEQGVVKAGVSGSLKDMALGIRDGLAGAEGLGDTRELASLLELVGEKEDALISLAKSDTLGGLVVLEEGVKFEFFGGVNRGSVDHTATHKLANLGSSDDVLLFGNWVADAEYSKRAGEYGEALVETAYAIAEKVSGLNMEGSEDAEDFAQFQQGFALFNEKFRTDTIALWDALSVAGDGLGNESALVVDLKGTVPPVPNVPQEIVDNGRFVRASLISPVTDRAKLQEGWSKLDGSMKNIFKTVSEMAGEDIPMQKPMSSEKDDFKTWFFSMPFFNDDFLPSVTVSDKWFVASTSKLQALELAGAADKAAEGERKGAWLELDFDTLRKFTGDWVNLLEAHGEVAFGDPDKFAAFKEELPRIKKGLEAFEEFDSLSISESIEGGKLRNSVHFKVR
ncbi:hypothetical protein OKA04_14585 [Luteolibacter flavescens]|uniref:DUF3352 domain-containing protein n=1 Tax=Luteolibacter flavescens TaxID=1859460 RepID=A0ABT3FQV7_9BACT|nr:hypothetical protein [Luteolibacter flavescens]MCW1885963.1 hypothetical protein [Luteolibacter flavescens]